jgi:hypothetical protein
VQDFIGCYTLNSGILMDRLRKVVRDQREAIRQSDQSQTALTAKERKETASDLSQNVLDSYAQAHTENNDEDALVVDFIHALRVDLPKPDVSTGKLQIEAFDAYVEGLDKALQAFITPDFLQSLEMGDSKEDVAVAVSYVKAFYVRAWLRANRVFPELESLTRMEDGKPVLEVADGAAAHVEVMRGNMGEYIKKVLTHYKQYNQDLNKIKANAGVDDTGGGGYTPDTSSTATSLDEGGGDLGDLGSLDDLDTGTDATDTGSPDDTEEEDDTATDGNASKPDASETP